MTADGGIGVVTQALDVAHGDQKKIHRPSAVITAAQVGMADQPMIHPAKAWRNLPLPIRTQQMLGNHERDTGFGCLVPGTRVPESVGPVLPPGARWARCPLVTCGP